jgi:hypothetical protein
MGSARAAPPLALPIAPAIARGRSVATIRQPKTRHTTQVLIGHQWLQFGQRRTLLYEIPFKQLDHRVA